MPKFTATALAVVILLLASAAAPADRCRPVPSEPPPRAGDYSRGLLWKIESAGAAPSYLFGTYHSNDPRITFLPCPVEEAFAGASSYVMELIFNGAGVTHMAQAMFFSVNDGQTLKQVLGEPLYNDTVRALGNRPDRRLDGLNSMKPWAVMMLLSTPRKEGSGLFLDMMLQARAIREGKENYGLETMEEQIAVFNGMNLEDQVALLRDAVNTIHLAPAAMNELTRAYLQRDLGTLMQLGDKYKGTDSRAQEQLMQRLLVQRNRNMAERLPARLKEGNAFIAVGALHLPGEDGLLQLLSKAGYRVTRVY